MKFVIFLVFFSKLPNKIRANLVLYYEMKAGKTIGAAQIGCNSFPFLAAGKL
jgi:hypothetical protein